MFKGLKSVIYPSSNLAADTAFWAAALGVEPYFEEAYYVGFKIGDMELGLDPNAASEGLSDPVNYWYVDEIDAASVKLLASGATKHGDVKDVGEGIHLATFVDKAGHIFGIIELHEN